MPKNDPLVWEAARQEAAQLLEEYSPDQYPLDVDRLAHFLDLEVTYRVLPRGISGIIVKTKKERPIVGISNLEPRARQRFTLAHEIGHYIDRLKLAEDEEYSFSDARGAEYDIHEFFADEFAGSILMPEPELRAAFMRHKGSDRYERIAKEFEVSVAALRMRVLRLQKNPPENHAQLLKQASTS